MKAVILLLCVSLLGSTLVNSHPHTKILLRDVSTLVFQEDNMAVGVKSTVPQMQCVGRNCYDNRLSTMQCKNTGFNGEDVTWACTAETGEYYKLGKTTVSCEGYAHPYDEYVTVGSCAVKYDLIPRRTYATHAVNRSSPGGDILKIVGIFFMFTISVALLSVCYR